MSLRRSTSSAKSSAKSSAAAVAAWIALLAAPAIAVPVQVRGGAAIAAQARGGLDEPLEISGTLADEQGAPLPSAWIALSAGGLPIAPARPCSAPSRVATAGGETRVETDRAGAFCVQWPAAPERGAISLRFAGDDLHGAADREIAFDRGAPLRFGASLGFDPPVSALALDRPLAITARIDLDPSASPAARAGLSIALSDETDRRLGVATTGGDGKAHFSIDPNDLGLPGPGKLVARFAGSESIEPATAEQIVSRQATVAIEAPDETAPADRGGEAVAEVRVRATRGVVDGGVVEAAAGGHSIGTAPVRAGSATLRLPIDGHAQGAVTLTLRYAPASPYFIPGRSATLRVPIALPSRLGRISLCAIVAAAGLWVFASWRRSKKRPEARRAVPLPPGVHAVEDARQPGHFRGTVIDAHDGSPLCGASIAVRGPSLDGERTLLRVSSDAEGRFAFEIPAEDRRRLDGAEIEAESPAHSRERRALPTGGTLTIALSSRRRTLVARLVSWARRAGRPFDHRPEPTPEQVRAAAGAASDIGAWASQVEAAAFGPGEVDAAAEERIHSIEPSGQARERR